jgi:hypothetical protein
MVYPDWILGFKAFALLDVLLVAGACSSPASPGKAKAAEVGAGGPGGGTGQAAAGGQATGGGGLSGGGISSASGGGAGRADAGAGGGAGRAATDAGLGGSGGAALVGGAGSGPTAGGAGAAVGGSGPTSCSITVKKSVSEKIPTVGIIEWSTDLSPVDSARIEFGLDTTYGLKAPVDLAEPGYRTLLLGMKTVHTYHFRVVASSGGRECASPDDTIDTGSGPNGLQKPTIVTNAPDKLYGGYMVTARWGTNNGGPAMILDADGDLVWWYPVEDDVIRARFSYDGKRLWIRNTSEADGGGWVRRITLDGLGEEKWDLTHTTHDLAVIPDGNVGLISHASNGCWEIMEFNPTTQELKSLFNPSEAHGSTMCQVNYLAYTATDDSFFVSDYRQSTVIKISRKGELQWVLNGTKSTISGTSWTSGQHGIHALAPDHLLVFSNNGETNGSNSIVYELMVDATSKTAQTLWKYDGGLKTPFGGDVQRLDNGNIIITYSSSGVIQELDAGGNLLQSFTFPIGASISYMEKRRSLYDSPPPKIHGL